MAASAPQPSPGPRLSVLLAVEDGGGGGTELPDRLARLLGTAPDQVELFAVAPQGGGPARDGPHIGVRVKSDKLTLSHVQRLLEENELMQMRLEHTSQALTTMQLQSDLHRRQLAELKALPGPPEAPSARGPSPPESARVLQRKLEASNRVLAAEVEELRARLVKSERFKKEVLQTVKDLKKQLAMLTEEIMTNDLEVDDLEGSDAEN
eukprot:EG_transcript_22267